MRSSRLLKAPMNTLSNNYRLSFYQAQHTRPSVSAYQARPISSQSIRFGNRSQKEEKEAKQSPVLDFCRKVWQNRYAAVLGSSLFGAASIWGGIELTPYTAPLFVAMETAGDTKAVATNKADSDRECPRSRTDDAHPDESPEEQVAERIDHMRMERDFTLQEIGVGTILGLAGLGVRDLILAFRRKSKSQ